MPIHDAPGMWPGPVTATRPATALLMGGTATAILRGASDPAHDKGATATAILMRGLDPALHIGPTRTALLMGAPAMAQPEGVGNNPLRLTYHC